MLDPFHILVFVFIAKFNAKRKHLFAFFTLKNALLNNIAQLQVFIAQFG